MKDGQQLEKGGKIQEKEAEERARARMPPLTGRLLVSSVDMLRRGAGLESSTFFLATLNSRLFGGT